MARVLPPERYEHAILCQEASGALPDLLRAEGWAIHEIGLAPHILHPGWHGKALTVARDFRPDIVHGAVFEGVALANGIGLRMPGVPVISEETSDPANRSWRGNLLMRGMCLRSKVVVGVSPIVGDYLRDTARIPKRKIRVVNNAVLPAPETSEDEMRQLRERYGLAAQDIVVGSVGRLLDSHKRFSDLIKAVALCRADDTRIKLLIVGDGSDRQTLATLARDLNIEDAVIFAGYQGEARKFYPLMDIFALASAREAFGLVLVEAMLAGVPVVATRVGGMPYVLDDGAVGRLVAPNAPEQFAEEIGQLARDENLRRALGDAGRRWALEKFSAERYCSEVDSLYQEIFQ